MASVSIEESLTESSSVGDPWKKHSPKEEDSDSPTEKDSSGGGEERRNWVELPRDVTASIVSRLGAIEILTSVQMVCKSWLDICKDPLTWRTVDMRNIGDPDLNLDLDRMCRRAVDLSCGQMLDINIEHFGEDDLLNYIAHGCSQIKRLRLACCCNISDEALIEAFAKLPLLEELDLTLCSFAIEPLEAVGRCCPGLKSMKLNCQACQPWDIDPDEEVEYNEEVIAIAKNMPELRHLQLIGNSMTNMGLQAILDGCPCLESLDLRRCLNINLKGNLGKKCADQIKYLRLPNDSMKGYDFVADPNGEVSSCHSADFSDDYPESDLYGDDYAYPDFLSVDDSLDYDEFTLAYDDDFNLAYDDAFNLAYDDY